MRDENCIFCKIANGEIPSATIYEDDDFRVILDLGPATKGHALILPKEHAADIYSIDEELAGKAFKLAKKITTLMSANKTTVIMSLIFNLFAAVLMVKTPYDIVSLF